MTNETLDVLFRPEDLPETKTGKGRDLSKSPFRGLLQGEEVVEMKNCNAAKQLSTGVYVCTNVFARDWAVLVPRAPDSAADIWDAELRLAIETRVYCRKANDSGREAPLGFRNFRVRVCGKGPSLLFVIR